MTELRARGLGCAIGDRWLVRDLDLAITAGEITVIVGPNGAGKTTLMRTLLGLRAAEAGEVTLGGAPLAQVPLQTRAKTMAWLPQRTELPWGLPVERLVMLGRAPHLPTIGGPTQADHRAVCDALDRVSARHLSRRDVRTLSGGERQRVLLARLLATGAPVLLLDEPTTALDVGHALALLELTRDLARSGHAIVLSLHELELARRYGDRALLLTADDRGGHELGPASTILTSARLSEVFEVRAELVEGQLRFGPP